MALLLQRRCKFRKRRLLNSIAFSIASFCALSVFPTSVSKESAIVIVAIQVVVSSTRVHTRQCMPFDLGDSRQFWLAARDERHHHCKDDIPTAQRKNSLNELHMTSGGAANVSPLKKSFHCYETFKGIPEWRYHRMGGDNVPVDDDVRNEGETGQ